MKFKLYPKFGKDEERKECKEEQILKFFKIERVMVKRE